MEVSVLTTTTTTPRRKRCRKPTFDPSRGWIHYKTSYLDAEIHGELVCLAAKQGIPVAQVLNMVLKAGLKAFR
jgi:hypothetical protein